MISKKLAAAAFGLCLTWGAHAGPGTVQDPQPQAASPADVPHGVGGTQDVIILELQGGGGPEEMAAMQMLLLQLLMMQGEIGAGGEAQMNAPPAPGLTGI